MKRYLAIILVAVIAGAACRGTTSVTPTEEPDVCVYRTPWIVPGLNTEMSGGAEYERKPCPAHAERSEP